MMENYIILLAILGLGIFFLLKKRQEKMSKSATGGQQARIKLPKLTVGMIVTLIIIAYVAAVIVREYLPPGATYTFNSANDLSSNWKVNSGNCVVQGGSLVGNCMISLKNPNVIEGWTRIEVAGGDLDGLIFQTGDFMWKYEVKKGKTTKDYIYLTGSIYNRNINRDHLLSSTANVVVEPGGRLIYPVGIKRVPWWVRHEQNYIVYVQLANEPFNTRTIAYAQGDSGLKMTSDGSFNIQLTSQSVESIKIYYY